MGLLLAPVFVPGKPQLYPTQNNPATPLLKRQRKKIS